MGLTETAWSADNRYYSLIHVRVPQARRCPRICIGSCIDSECFLPSKASSKSTAAPKRDSGVGMSRRADCSGLLRYEHWGR